MEPDSTTTPSDKQANDAQPPLPLRNANGATRLTRTSIVVQVIGFVLGIILLIWCIRRATEGANDFQALRSADPALLVALIGFGLISVVANGLIFWALIRRIVPIPMMDVQLVNCVVNVLNYAPVRLGMIVRLAHHRRVDHVPYAVLVAWYGAVALIALLVFVALIGATMLRPRVDMWWWGLFVTLNLAGMTAITFIARHDLLSNRWHGAMRMLSRWDSLAGVVLLRIIDVAAYGGRLYIALRIIGVEVTFQEWLYLTLLSMVSALSPVGTLGFREFAIAFFGSYLTGSANDTDFALIQSQLAEAALVDRAAEAAIFVPLGIVSVIWMLRRWRRSGRPIAAE